MRIVDLFRKARVLWHKHLYSPTARSNECFVLSRPLAMRTETVWRSCFQSTRGSGSARLRTLTIADVATHDGQVRREVKLGAHQTKGPKGRTVVLSSRVRNEIEDYLRGATHRRGHSSPLVSSQRNRRAFTNVTLSMMFKAIYEMAGIRTSSHSGRRTFATRLNAKGVGMRTIQKLMGHRHIGTTALYCDVSDETLRHAVELV